MSVKVVGEVRRPVAVGVRSVPLPGFFVDALWARRDRLTNDARPSDLVFAGPLGTAPRRANFRTRVWFPSLVRAGLLG